MEQVLAYNRTNYIQNDVNASILERYFNLLHWKENTIVMDIGMGDGKFTKEGLLPILEKYNIKQLIGIDVSPEKVAFARNNYSPPNIEYVTLDIQSQYPPSEFTQRFDYMFSFFCLHWVQDLRTCFKNVFNMMRPGGEFLFTFPEHGIEFALQELAKNQKWSTFGHEQYISEFVDTLDTLESLRNIIRQAGFNQLNCFRENVIYNYETREACEEMYKSINPVAQKIPENDLNNYYADYLRALEKVGTIGYETCPNTGDVKCNVHITMITLYGKKVHQPLFFKHTLIKSIYTIFTNLLGTQITQHPKEEFIKLYVEEFYPMYIILGSREYIRVVAQDFLYTLPGTRKVQYHVRTKKC